MSSLHAIQLLTAAARFAQVEQESFSQEGIVKKLQDIKYLSSQKKVPRLSLRKEIIHLENQLQGVLGLEERFARQKDKESITVASLKQQLAVLKTKLKAVEDLELDKKVDHLSFLLGEHLAKREIAGEVELAQAAESSYAEEEKPEARAKKAMMLQKRLEASKQELEIYRELKTKSPGELRQIEGNIKAFEEKLQQYCEEAKSKEEAVETSPQGEVKHTLLFPQAESKEAEEEIMGAEKELPLPPPPRMRRRE